jgi:cyclase
VRAVGDAREEENAPLKLQRVSGHCFAVLNETNLVCDANSGLIDLGEGVVVDTQSDLPHAREMI